MSDYSVNMSFGGIFIESENVLPADTTLFVEFKLPVNNRRIKCKSRVAWTNEPQNPKSSALPAGMGLQFTDLSLDYFCCIPDRWKVFKKFDFRLALVIGWFIIPENKLQRAIINNG